VNVLISGGFSGAYEQLLPEFERTSGIKVTTGSGALQGAGPQTIAAQLARGVPANVVILPREGLSELIAAKRIVAIQPPFRQVLPLCDHAILRALEDALLFERFAHSTPDEQLNARCLNKNAPDGDSVSTDDIVIVIAVSAGASRLSLSE